MGQPGRDQGCGEHEGDVTAPAICVCDRGGSTADRLGIDTPGPVPHRLQVDTDHRLAVPAPGDLLVRAGPGDRGHPTSAGGRRPGALPPLGTPHVPPFAVLPPAVLAPAVGHARRTAATTTATAAVSVLALARLGAAVATPKW